MTDTLPIKRWTRPEYARLIECGAFGPDERIELLGGLLVVREPQRGPDALGIRMVQEALRRVFREGWDVRGRLPVALDNESEPEPDVSVVPGSFRDYADDHPAHPALVVEIAESSLPVDRGEKAGLYARAGLADYWIVNLVARVLEIYRDPVADPAAPYGWRYASVATLRHGDVVTPLAAPAGPIPVADLVP
jgi:Uma2 family endonuclease